MEEEEEVRGCFQRHQAVMSRCPKRLLLYYPPNHRARKKPDFIFRLRHSVLTGRAMFSGATEERAALSFVFATMGPSQR